MHLIRTNLVISPTQYIIHPSPPHTPLPEHRNDSIAPLQTFLDGYGMVRSREKNSDAEELSEEYRSGQLTRTLVPSELCRETPPYSVVSCYFRRSHHYPL